MYKSLLLGAVLVALAGCVSVQRAPEPSSTTDVAPAPMVSPSVTTTTTKQWN